MEFNIRTRFFIAVSLLIFWFQYRTAHRQTCSGERYYHHYAAHHYHRHHHYKASVYHQQVEESDYSGLRETERSFIGEWVLLEKELGKHIKMERKSVFDEGKVDYLSALHFTRNFKIYKKEKLKDSTETYIGKWKVENNLQYLTIDLENNYNKEINSRNQYLIQFLNKDVLYLTTIESIYNPELPETYDFSIGEISLY